MKKILVLGAIAVLISITVIASAQRFGDPIRGRIPDLSFDPHPQYEIFMKIEGIPGESTDSDHRGWIDILSYEFGGEGEIDESTRLPTGRRIHNSLVIRKRIDNSTPHLVNYTGEPFFDIFIDVVGEDGTFMKYKFSDTMISSYSVTGIPTTGQLRPIESISIDYEKAEFVYTQYDKRGRIISTVESVWDDS